jgi:hypothetical protein
MLTKTKMALAAALVLGSASATLAQEIVPEVDGDGNRTGVYDALPQANTSQARGAIERSFAGPRHQMREPVYSDGANGPAWERNFENWLQQN